MTTKKQRAYVAKKQSYGPLSPHRLRAALLVHKRGDFISVLSQGEERCLKYFGFRTLAEFLTSKTADNGIGMTPEMAKGVLVSCGRYGKEERDLIKRLEVAALARDVKAAKKHGSNEKESNMEADSIVATQISDPMEKLGHDIGQLMKEAVKMEHDRLNKRILQLEGLLEESISREHGMKAGLRRLYEASGGRIDG